MNPTQRLLAVGWPAVLLAGLLQAAPQGPEPPRASKGPKASEEPDTELRPETPPNTKSALQKALAFLCCEVPAWPKSHACFSCHNNGDAARALYTARRLGVAMAEPVLADTTRWLASPAGWKDHAGSPEFSDEELATLQFAAALLDATNAGAVQDESALKASAELVARSQSADGSWQIGAGNLVGSPATYGPVLSTAVARRVLRRADRARYSSSVTRADEWLRAVRPQAMVDLAGVLMGLGDAADDAARHQRQRCVELIERGQGSLGGWGPFADHKPEAFDTAVVLLGLKTLGSDERAEAAIERGRRYLIASQLADGSWRATTRPANSTSYAQQLSTTGWATLALLATASADQIPEAAGQSAPDPRDDP